MKYKPYKWSAHVNGCGTFDVSHLDCFSFVHNVAARQRGPGRAAEPAMDITVNTAFSHHCFTNSANSPLFAPDDIYNYPEDVRSFCVKRYELSRALPLHVRLLGKKRCFRTHHANFFAVAVQLSSGGFYTVYFQVEPCRTSVLAVNLLVESAYVRSQLPVVGRGAYQESFTSIVVKKLKR